MMKTLFYNLNTLMELPLQLNDVFVSPSFFVTIFAGVIIALAFQFILTAISVASGITAIGNVKETFVKSKVEPGNSNGDGEQEFDQDYSSGTATGVKLVSGFGIWSVVTTSIALFGATALALNLNIVESGTTNTVTSLVIWALFFLILFYLEVKVARTVIGNLISAVTSGLRSSADTLTSLFSSSPESKIENLIDTTVDRIRKEFDSGPGMDKLTGVLDNFLSRVDNKIPDYEDLRSDLETIAKKSSDKNTSGKWMAVQQVLTKAISENSSSDDADRKGKAQKLKEIYDSVVSKYNASPGKMEGMKNVVQEFTSLEREQINEGISRAKQFLGSTTSDNLNADGLETNIKKIMKDPSLVSSMIAENFENLNRESIIDTLGSNSNLSKDQLETYADNVQKMLKKVAGEFDKDNEDRLVNRVEERVANFFNSSGRAELDYEVLKNDLKRVMDDPKDSLDIIKQRFATFDDATLRAVVTNNKYISEDQIDKVLETIGSGKNEIMDKISQIQNRADQHIEMAKRKAVIKAEHARATAASAAWWLVLSTIISAVAAMAGSVVAL